GRGRASPGPVRASARKRRRPPPYPAWSSTITPPKSTARKSDPHRPRPASRSNASGAVESDGDLVPVHDHRHLPHALGVLEHLLQPRGVGDHVDVLERDLPARVVVARRGRVGAVVLPVDQHRHRYPPMAYMARCGFTNFGSLMPWPASFLATAPRKRSARSASVAPDLRGPLR